MPIDLEKKVQVNTYKFFEAIKAFDGDSQCSQSIENIFNIYGVSNADIYTDPDSTDKQLWFKHSTGSAPSYLNLRKVNGAYVFTEGLNSLNVVATINDHCANLVFGLTLGGNVTSDGFEDILVESARTCIAQDGNSKCDQDRWDRTIKAAKIFIANAEHFQDGLFGKAQHNRFKIQVGTEKVRSAREVLTKVIAADAGLGGIDPDDVTEIMNEYDLVPPMHDETLAEQYEFNMEEMLMRVLASESALLALQSSEQGPIDGCLPTEITRYSGGRSVHIRCEWTYPKDKQNIRSEKPKNTPN